MRVEAGSKCAKCKEPAELAVQAAQSGKTMLLCRRCATNLAKQYNLPSLTEQLERDNN